jgi:hypothetical protein
MSLASTAPAPDRHRLAELLDQQMWFFGRDIQHPEGNLLLRFGFTRERPPVAVSGTSRYTMTTPVGSLTLWGWGVLWRDREPLALLMRRHGPGPRLVSAAVAREQVWAHTALTDSRAAASDELARVGMLLADFAGWVHRYERWVRDTCGESWRRECAELRPRHVRRKQMVAPALYVQTWQQIAHTAVASA